MPRLHVVFDYDLGDMKKSVGLWIDRCKDMLSFLGRHALHNVHRISCHSTIPQRLLGCYIFIVGPHLPK